MYFEQFFLSCLAHASYMLGSQGVAVVVDPQRDVEIYLQAAAEQGFKIAHIFETHLHADFVSGHQELAARTGAKIYIGERAGAKFPHVPLRDGFELAFGDCRIRALETPGHTPESVCLLIFDPGKEVQPWAALTGDTLFIGDVGRPDLSPTHTPQQLAALLYDSLHDKLLTLPDETLVYPAHGAGSLCGRNMRADRFSTIATERLTNPSLQIKGRDEFVRQLTAHLPPRPQYFAEDAAINREGAPALSDLPALPALSPAEVKEGLEAGITLLDTRPAGQFAAGHVPGAINIALGGQYASWAGTLLGLHAPIILVTESPEKLEESRVRLARVGIEEVVGHLNGGVADWQQAGYPVATMPMMTVQELQAKMDRLQVLDVRREPEWTAGHIAGAAWKPLDDFRAGLPALDKDAPIAVHCKSGYRSMIAASWLRRAGFTNVTNLVGGFDAWAAASLPVEKEAEAKTTA
jgi:hydroxyacylglutathione hydrolase